MKNKLSKNPASKEEITLLLKEQTTTILGAVDSRLEKMSGKIDKIDGRMDKIDGRMDRLETGFGGRMDRLESNIEKMEARFNKRLDQLMTTLDKFLKRLTDFEDEFTILKKDVNHIKTVLRDKLGVNLL